jgi:hypothetical protein
MVCCDGRKDGKFMSLTAYKKLNLPLPESMHEALFAESREAGVPATRLVRSVLEEWLLERRRARRREEVRRFAQGHAGTELDLDPDLDAAATAELQHFYEDEDETR